MKLARISWLAFATQARSCWKEPLCKMMKPEREPSEHAAEGSAQQQPQDSYSVPDASVLGEVVRATLDASDRELVEAELHALSAIAGQYKGQSLATEPVAQKLIEAVVRIRLSDLSASDGQWQSMSAEVARTLLEDPSQRERLEALWHRLCELNR